MSYTDDNTDRATIRYSIDHWGHYRWTLALPYDEDDDEPAHFCANGYATFAGDQIGEHQIHGWASAPPPTNPRAWFVRFARDHIYSEYRSTTKISVRHA